MELIQRIGVTEFCITYETSSHSIFIKLFVGDDDVGGTLAEQPLINKTIQTLTTRSPDYTALKNQIETSNAEKLSVVKDSKSFFVQLSQALNGLRVKYDLWIVKQEQRAEEDRKKDEEVKQLQEEEAISDGYDFLDETETPLYYIANEIDWFTAGERLNILYAWIAYCSQVVLDNPISVIAIGEGGSGKTHILETALDLIPEEYKLTMKSSTMAAVYHMADIDPFYFDKKIINIGDMGGSSDHEEADEFKNIIKEMQTEGRVSRTKMVKGPDGDQEAKQFELFGFPCLTYTNVPNHDYDDQEISRSIFLTPREDNERAVTFMKSVMRQRGTPTEQNVLNHEKNKIVIKNMVKALRKRMENVAIWNPYTDALDKFLATSKYKKRDADKYDGILRVITAINGYKRDLFEHNGQLTLFTTKEDIVIFIELLERYHDSIASNLTPRASDLLTELRENSKKWNIQDIGITTVEYLKMSRTKLSKRSVQKYFGELNEKDFLEIVDIEGNNRRYKLNDGVDSIAISHIELSELDKKVLKYNYNIDTFDSFIGHPSPGLLTSSMNGPFWNDLLPENG